ncbi:MAG: NIL domain-containing protein [Candidatus Omnitrophota bacterium]
MKIKAEFIFPKELKDEPLICDICKQFNIRLNIVEASFSTDTGWAILVLEAKDAEIIKTLKYLADKGVEIKETKQIG